MTGISANSDRVADGDDETAVASPTAWFSLRRRLLALLLGGVSACWLSAMAWTYYDAHHEIDELFDSQLVLEAQTLLALAEHEADEMVDLDNADYREQKRLRFQAWTDDGRLILHSPDAPSTPLAAIDGFSESTDGEGKHPHWRYYSRRNAEHNLRIIVGENHHVRDELIGAIALRLLVPALLGLPLLGAWVWLATRRGLQPLAAVALEIASRDSDHLVELRPARAPEEVRPLVEAINSLFTRVEQTLESERRFTADAAHELRTPLAALTAQAQVAMQARSAAEREHAMAQLATSLRRATRLVDQILTLARLDPEDRPPTGRVDLGGLAEEVCARHGALALEKDIALELNAEPVTVPGDSDMLRILLRNLVDNAIRYTPVGGQVTVAVTREGLSVTDSGPGIPVEERARVFNRFHRLAGQDIEGSGLGLSIVARIAERHGAAISLDSGADGRGLKISVRFPVSARQAPSGVS